MSYTLKLTQGESGLLIVRYQDSAGDPISLAPYGFAFIIWDQANEILITLIEGGGISIDAATSEITITIPSVLTKTFNPKVRKYELWLTHATDSILLLTGAVVTEDTRYFDA